MQLIPFTIARCCYFVKITHNRVEVRHAGWNRSGFISEMWFIHLANLQWEALSVTPQSLGGFDNHSTFFTNKEAGDTR